MCSQNVTSMPECKFQLMAAFGIPAETQDMSPLYAWLRRNADMPFGLIMHNVDGMLQQASVKQQFQDILAQIVKVCASVNLHRKLHTQCRGKMRGQGSLFCMQAAPHSQLIVTAQEPTELLDQPTVTWHMSECSADHAAAISGQYEVNLAAPLERTCAMERSAGFRSL